MRRAGRHDRIFIPCCVFREAARNTEYATRDTIVDSKHWTTLELPKVLARLASHTSFSAGGDLARALSPSTDPDTVTRRLRETSEARRLLNSKTDVGLGGVHDVRPFA